LANGSETPMRCPKCGGRDVRRSYSRHHIVDTFMLSFHRRPFRCRFCECRFYRYAPGTLPGPVETVGAPDLGGNKTA